MIDDFDRIVSTAHLEAAGWQLEDFHHSNPFQSHAFYVCDYRNGGRRVLLVNKTDFRAFEAHPDLEANDMASLVAELVERMGAGVLSETDKTVLGSALVGYFKVTQTCRAWLAATGVDDRLHAILHVYPGGYIRPFVARTPGTLLDAETLEMLTAQVLQMDRQAHPEWFVGGSQARPN